jgi:predicted transcriptional regulator
MYEEFKKYIKAIPEDFELFLKSFGHIFRLNIVIFLKRKGAQSFSSIAEQFNSKTSLVNTHIKKLEIAGIIQNFIKKSEETREYSFYETTKYGDFMVSNFVSNYIEAKNLEISNPYDLIKESEELNLFLRVIKSKFRFALAKYIIEKGPLSFSEIFLETNKEKSSIANHLNRLDKAGIIENYFEKKPESNEYSFYKITNSGCKLINSLIESYNQYYKTLETDKDEIGGQIIEAGSS